MTTSNTISLYVTESISIGDRLIIEHGEVRKARMNEPCHAVADKNAWEGDECCFPIARGSHVRLH